LWQQAQWLADEVATGRAALRELEHAQHYHTVHVQPIWRHGLRQARRIGQHIFYVPLNAQPDLSIAVKVKYKWDELGEVMMLGGPEPHQARLEVTAAQSEMLPKVAAPVVKKAVIAPVQAQPVTSSFQPFADQNNGR
jgi:hypothetical protein